MNIRENIRELKTRLPVNVKLVAVSKTKPDGIIMEAYDAGHRIFGENKAMELQEKYESLPKDIEWHYIGHLQRNKVRYIASFVSLIHGVDSLRLLQEINKQAKKADRNIDCLLQFYIAEETSKFGFDMEECRQMLVSIEFNALENINIRGVMGMATYTDDTGKIGSEFRKLKNIFNELKGEFFTKKDDFNEVSMGMSDDFSIAIEEGSTMVRIGSLVFGKRHSN